MRLISAKWNSSADFSSNRPKNLIIIATVLFPMIVHHDLLIVQLYFSYRPQWPQNNIGLFKFSGDRNNWFNIDKPIFK